MEHPRPVLPSQRFSPSPAYGYDSRRGTPSLRQPLRDTTGNAQPGHPGLASCRQSPLIFSPAHSTISTPTVPSQANSTFRGSLRPRADRLSLSRRQRHDINPIYFAPEFRPYRDKQDQKDPKEKQIWTPVLEDAFLDALLIIPHMGRKKYSMNGMHYGRNMLISEYLWIAYCWNMQPGQAETEKSGRKQVSSHIQVVKKMFEKHRCYHFFFLPNPDKRKDARQKDTVESESFKNNPVLLALSKGRLPDVRPNYEYFAQILAMDSHVVMRPKTCWIFVSSSELKVEDSGNVYDRSGKLLDVELYPHLEKNLQKEEGMTRGLNGSVLLHEYNRDIAQKEAAAVTELAQDWQAALPDLHESLELAIQDNKWLDILEMNVTLDLHPRSNFPGGSELNGFVEISIAQPGLQNHRWKCITRLARPAELCRDPDHDPLLIEQTSEVGVQYTHRPGCDDRNADCECRNRPRQDVRVPFPAAEWASILSNCASYLEPLDAKAMREGKIDEEKSQVAIESERTTTDLISQVGMFQELWSSPPDVQDRRWTRRGIILWRFQTIYVFDDKGNPLYEQPAQKRTRKGADGSSPKPQAAKRVFNPPGTTWRFLTALDPASTAHQQHVCITPSTLQPNRDVVMAPTPHYSHHLAAAMSENMNAAWDAVTLPGNLPSLSSTTSTLSMLDGFAHGLATPPPTASLNPSYANSFDGSQGIGGGQHHLDFLAVACTSSMDGQSSLVSDVGASSADPFLAASMHASGGVSVGVYDDGLPSWDATGTLHGLDHWNAGWDDSTAAKAAPQWPGDSRHSANAAQGLWAEQPQWAQAVSAVAAVAGTDVRSGWDERSSPSPWSAGGVDPSRSRGERHNSLKTMSMVGQKRARSNSLDMENRENFPASTIPKLNHHRGSMGDGGHGHRGSTETW